MLIKCPECELQLSDKAVMCPHCGYPMKEAKIYRRSNKRKRLPNGFGQISEIKGRNLRKPFRAMVTVGKRENGRPICKPLKPVSYFSTYNDAYAALMEFNKKPFDLTADTTIKEIYDRWSKEFYPTIGKVSKSKYVSAWKYCESVYDLDIRLLRIPNIKFCMYEAVLPVYGKMTPAHAQLKNTIKSLFSKILDYAMEYEYVTHNVAKEFELSKEVKEKIATKNSHVGFTESEMNMLWKHVGERWADMILVGCYSGWRPKELCLLKIENISLDEGRFVGGMKTAAGKNRSVPIHSKILPIIKRYYDLSKEYLFESDYISYYNDLNAHMNLFEIKHRPHDTRAHFITKAKEAGVDEYAIKYMVGHAIQDLTEKVYTKRSFEWLKEEIEKIDCGVKNAS